MYSAITNIFYKILVLLLSLSVGCSGGSIFPSQDALIKAKDEDNCKMTAVLWADMQISDYLLSRNEPMKAACRDIAAMDGTMDALVLAGDIAENGKGSEYRVVLDNLNMFTPKNFNRISLNLLSIFVTSLRNTLGFSSGFAVPF